MQTATLQASAHGKSRVRVAKVQRHGSHHDFTELTVQIELLGGTESSFESSDNSGVVATDTCRNHVYMLAKTHNMSSPEMFAIDLADVFIRSYVHVRAVKIGVEERAWRRYTASGEMHSHGFVLDGQGEGTCNIFQTGNNITLTSGLKGLSVLKTTQSGWANFLRDKYTTLPETNERILATTINATWKYMAKTRHGLMNLNFRDVHVRMREAFVGKFFGPIDSGVFSHGLQNTLFKMGCAAIRTVREIEHLSLSLPNIHFLPCNLPVFERNGVLFEDDVFIPSDEPHGIITAQIGRKDVGIANERRARL